MRRRFAVVLFLVSVVAFSQTVQSPNYGSRPAVDPTGSYEGVISLGDATERVVTEISRGTYGEWVGSYEFEDGGVVEPGELYDGRFEGPYTLSFEWKDRFGTGRLRIVMAGDGSAFTGFWGESDESAVYFWTGDKGE